MVYFFLLSFWLVSTSINFCISLPPLPFTFDYLGPWSKKSLRKVKPILHFQQFQSVSWTMNGFPCVMPFPFVFRIPPQSDIIFSSLPQIHEHQHQLEAFTLTSTRIAGGQKHCRLDRGQELWTQCPVWDDMRGLHSLKWISHVFTYSGDVSYYRTVKVGNTVLQYKLK